MTLELPHSEQNLPKSILAQYSCDGTFQHLHICALEKSMGPRTREGINTLTQITLPHYLQKMP